MEQKSSVEVGDSQVLKQLHGIVFDDVLRSTGKVRFENNNNDYAIAHKINDGLVKGKDDTVAVNLVTPEHENYSNEAVLVGRNMGGVELMAVLPEQGRLLDQLRSYLTDLYIRQNSGGDDELLESILTARGQQNAERRRELGESQKSNYALRG